jgi:hypothetical protein
MQEMNRVCQEQSLINRRISEDEEDLRELADVAVGLGGRRVDGVGAG